MSHQAAKSLSNLLVCTALVMALLVGNLACAGGGPKTPTPTPTKSPVLFPTSTPTRALPTVASTPSPSPSPTLLPLPLSATPTPTETVYVVQPGDTLYKISRDFGVSVEAIVAANQDLIEDPNLVKVGWKLIIPEPE